METAVGIILALLGILAAYFYARSTHFEIAQAELAREESGGKVAALEAELKAKRDAERARDKDEGAAIVEAADSNAASDFLSNSFRARRGPPN